MNLISKTLNSVVDDQEVRPLSCLVPGIVLSSRIAATPATKGAVDMRTTITLKAR